MPGRAALTPATGANASVPVPLLARTIHAARCVAATEVDSRPVHGAYLDLSSSRGRTAVRSEGLTRQGGTAGASPERCSQRQGSLGAPDPIRAATVEPGACRQRAEDSRLYFVNRDRHQRETHGRRVRQFPPAARVPLHVRFRNIGSRKLIRDSEIRAA
jgi:hypothetical protein